jgi:nanoRNase/pAp phosphatase (c-di-AMP/oligoRNAs hydrolase)
MSEIGHELATTGGTFGLIWYLGENNKAKISLRSNGDHDVSAIAKQFGGGGHKNAAGFEVDILTLLGWLV